MTNSIDRSLTVTADGERLPFSGRTRLSGQDGLSLFPALFTLELWNLPEEAALRLSRCRSISVCSGEACLVSGAVSDVYRRPARDGVLTSVSISLGLDLWESVVSLTVPAGTTASETVRRILAASGTGISLLSFPETDPISVRSHSFLGRAPECIVESLSTVHYPLSTAFPRAMLTPSGLMVVSPGGLPNPVMIAENDLAGAPAFVNGGRLAILSCAVSGWRPGQTAEVRWKEISFRGIIRSRSVDADTGSGPWKCEMIVEVL